MCYMTVGYLCLIYSEWMASLMQIDVNCHFINLLLCANQACYMHFLTYFFKAHRRGIVILILQLEWLAQRCRHDIAELGFSPGSVQCPGFPHSFSLHPKLGKREDKRRHHQSHSRGIQLKLNIVCLTVLQLTCSRWIIFSSLDILAPKKYNIWVPGEEEMF